MRFAARLLLALWLSAAGTLGLAADDLVAVPALKAHVTDLAGLLSGNQATALEARLAQFEKVHGSQIAILLVPTTQPEAIESYAIRVAEAWKIGRTGIEDGILLLVARNDRTLRIEVGRGLEGVLPDAVAKRIITEVIEPRFGEGDFFGGLQDGVMRIEAVLAGEPLPPPQERARGAPSADIWESLVPLAMLFVFVAGGLLRALFGRLLGGAVAGGVAFLGGWLLLGSVSLALLVAVVVFFLTLLGVAGVGGMRGLGGRGGFGGGGASGRW